MSAHSRRFLILLLLFAGIVVVGVGAAYVSRVYFEHEYMTAHHGCSPAAVNHIVTIAGGAPTPAHTIAARCDTLTITNTDSIRRLIAFGRHDSHVPYDGIEERLLTQGQSMVVTLDQSGEFLFHDHLHDEVQATFTVQ